MSKNLACFVGLLLFLTGCYSFDKEVALNEFKQLKPNCEITNMFDYECSGTMGECAYVDFKYKCGESETVMDTTLQYWRVDDRWITKKEFGDRQN